MNRTQRHGTGMGGAHRSRGKDEWITPRFVLDALPVFDLDPCAAVGQPWPTATSHMTIEDDGLDREWYGFVWCNPPYGRATGEWLARMADHRDGIALIFARTETRMFVDEVWSKADAVLFLHGRLWFHHVSGERASANSGAPSVLVAYGDRAVVALEASGLNGSLVTNWSAP